MAEKSEKATPKKLRDARKKGQVAKSQDFPAAFTFSVSLALVIGMSTHLYQELASMMITFFRFIPKNVQLKDRAAELMSYSISTIFRTSIPIMGIVASVGVLVNFIIVGPLFSAEAMKPDIKKLNPISNLKNLFKIKTFVELIKSIAKISGALILIYMVVKDSLSDIIATASLPIIGSAIVFSDFLFKVAVRVGIFFLTVAIFDLVFQKKNFAKTMMMEKYEVKQEYKDTEGDPHIKGKRKQAAQELAYQDGPSSTKRAKAVITNPTHIAVALEYEADVDPAPKILTMGKDIVANKIVQVAQQYDVPIMRNVTLAHQLFEMGKISQYVPEDTYSAIAEILKWLAQLEESDQTDAEYNPEIFQ